MKKKHVVFVVGTRPEAIKVAPVYLAMKTNRRIKTTFLATAQHRQMLDQVLNVFDIKCDIDLDLMQPDQSLSQVSASVIESVQKTLSRLKPDIVLVHGDTTTCLCSAIAAFYEQIRVGHIEAGLRTYDFNAPWPEEMNRRLVDPICRWCFAPTARAADNLRAERIPEDNIFITGNTVVDALLIARDLTRKNKPIVPGLGEDILDNHRLVLVTGHRRESFGRPFEEFCMALRQLVKEHPDIVLVYPVHLNPNVQEPVHKILGRQERIYLIEPIEYLPFVYLMDQSCLIITDSGGIQEEAPSLHKPVLVTRAVTERPEAMEAGIAKLVGTSKNKILKEATLLLNDPKIYAKMSQGHNPYGDGHASERIVDILLSTVE